MKLQNSRGNLLNGRAPRQADFFPRQWLISHLRDVRHRTTLHSKPVQNLTQRQVLTCWDGEIPSAPTHLPLLDHPHGGQGSLYTVPGADLRALCPGGFRNAGGEWESPNHTPKMLQGIPKRDEQHISSWEQRHIRSTSLSLSINLKQNVFFGWRSAVVVAQVFFGWIKYNFVLRSSTR